MTEKVIGADREDFSRFSELCVWVSSSSLRPLAGDIKARGILGCVWVTDEAPTPTPPLQEGCQESDFSPTSYQPPLAAQERHFYS